MNMNVSLESRRAEIGRERRERTRAKLISAAARVIAQHGQAKATIDDFIQAAGVARGTFYNYFLTREQLIEAVWAHLGREPFLEIHRACEEIDDPAERLVAETRMIVDRVARDHVWGWLVYSMSGDLNDVNEDLLKFPMPGLLAGLRTNRFEVTEMNAARDMVVSTVRAAVLAALSGRSSPSYVEEICIMILLALRVRSTENMEIVTRPLPATAS